MNKLTKNLITFILLCLSIYIIFLLYPKISIIIKSISKLILPFIIAYAIAYVLNPCVNFLEKYLQKRVYAVIITIIILLLIIYMLFSFIIPFFINESKEFMNNYDNIMISIEIKLNEICEKLSFLPSNFQPSLSNIKNTITNYFDGIRIDPKNLIDKISDYIDLLLIIPMSSIYFMIDFEKIKNKIKNKIIEKNNLKLYNYLSELNKAIYSFIKTTFFIMIIMLMLSSITFWILKLKYSFVFGLIIAITNIIPYIGPYIGGAIPVLSALVDSSNKAVIVLIAIIIIQIIESDILSPYLHGKNNDLHPLLVLFSLIIFGNFFGIIGMILSVPLMSIIKITLKYYNFKSK